MATILHVEDNKADQQVVQFVLERMEKAIKRGITLGLLEGLWKFVLPAAAVGTLLHVIFGWSH